MNTIRLVVDGALCVLLCGLAAGQQQPKIHEEVTVRWWLVPVYAVDKAGAAVLDLAPEDLEVYIKGLRVEPFSLIKKQFEVTRSGKPGAAALAKAPAQKKMVFLVFDAAFSPYNLLANAKAIADTVIGQSDKAAQYVLLSIEPFAGLNHIAGPTRDLGVISKSMKKYIAGKKADYLFETNAMDKNEIQDPYPAGDPRNQGATAGPQAGAADWAARWAARAASPLEGLTRPAETPGEIRRPWPGPTRLRS